MDREKTIYVCKQCSKVLGCNGVLTKGVNICDGQYADCPTRKSCDIKKNVGKYNHYHIMSDGRCDECYEGLVAQGVA